jgi:DNA polymerase III subunit epsilon
MRQIVLDTETTGLEVAQGHRVIEIGAVELLNRRLTGRHFHRYVNPQREIDDGAFEVHGLSLEFLRDKPTFAEIAAEFVSFVEGAELVIHNAPFDVAFLDYELSLLPDVPSIRSLCRITDSLALARHKHPGQKNSLDALCRRYQVDNSARELHGALLDAEILADVYLAMTGGQTLLFGGDHESGLPAQQSERPIAPSVGDRTPLRVLAATAEEAAAHERLLDLVDRRSTAGSVWRRIQEAATSPGPA